ncbi:MAG: hypothetical protein M3485_06830 [Pseudomonadota bacterium]|nr:hypothetical protein [Pseudomonadota bacterium]
MNTLPACLLASLLTLSAVACRPADAPATVDSDPSAAQRADDAASAAHARPPAMADGPTPPVAEGAEITYRCGGGELHVHYAGGRAHVTLADGRSLDLALDQALRTPSGGEAFSGDSVALRRSGNVVELQQPGQGTQVCTESSASG